MSIMNLEIKQKKKKHKQQKDLSATSEKLISNLSKKRKSESGPEIKKKKVTFSENVLEKTFNNESNEELSNESNEVDNELPLTPEELEKKISLPENKKNVISKRQRKKSKYEKLKAEQKLKSETKMQQKALNYLSLWKHNRQEWKFEKLRQLWLQNNMFDDAKLPEEFWDTTIQYFENSKGKIRQFLIENCTKIVDEEDQNENNVKLKRARELLQNLHE